MENTFENYRQYQAAKSLSPRQPRAGRINARPRNVVRNPQTGTRLGVTRRDGSFVAMAPELGAGKGTFHRSRADNVAAAMADGTFHQKREAFNRASKTGVMDEAGNISAAPKVEPPPVEDETPPDSGYDDTPAYSPPDDPVPEASGQPLPPPPDPNNPPPYPKGMEPLPDLPPDVPGKLPPDVAAKPVLQPLQDPAAKSAPSPAPAAAGAKGGGPALAGSAGGKPTRRFLQTRAGTSRQLPA